MKRAWMKKVKAVSTRAASNNAPEEQINPVRPKAKRRVRTSAAMIGIAISIGTSSLLITRQSDRTPAAEPTGSESMVSTISTAPKVAQGKRTGAIEPKAVKSPLSTPQRATRVNQLLQKLKYRQQVRTLSRAYKVNRSQITVAAVTAASESPQGKELVSNSGEVNNALKTRQRALINSLKQKPNHLRERLVAWKAQEAQQNQAINAPFVLGTVQAQQQVIERSPQAAKLDNSKALDLQQSQPIASAPFVIPDVTQAGFQKQKLVTASISPNYQVKAGDTLTAIALQHGIPLFELVKANKLTNPNRIQINQRLQIPGESQANASVTATNNSEQPNAVVPLESPNGSQNQEVSFGMGGDISDDDSVVPTPPSTIAEIQRKQTAAARAQLQSNLYVQELRSDIEKLRQKYSAQSPASQLMPQANVTNNVFAGATNSQPRPNLPANQPINPEFRAAQVPDKSKSEAKKQPSSETGTDAPPNSSSSLATAPLGLNTSNDAVRGQQVSPDLPPLGAAGTYLPQPASTSTKGLIWPSKGVISSGYGWRWGRMHKGIDIAAPVGTPVMAAAPGVVVKAGWNSGGYGNLVDIQHADGTLTRYAHNKKVLVHTGQQVEQGQQISEMGSTGFSTGPHLHFEVHPLGKKAVNPIAYLPGK